MVSEKLLIELQAIIKECYGRELPLDEVSRIGNGLVNAFEILAKIDYEERKEKQ